MNLAEIESDTLREMKLHLENQRDGLKKEIMAIQAEINGREAKAAAARKLANMTPAEREALKEIFTEGA